MSTLGEYVRPGLPRHVAWAERVGEERERRRIDAERVRIARELHDVVGFGFAAINLQAGVAAQALEQCPEQVVEALQAIKAASKEAMEELRGILGMLRQVEAPPASSCSLRGVDELVRRANQAGVPTGLEISGSPRPLPVAIEQAAYRIVQEALANVLRHAGPASAWVSITFESDRLVISIEDDGCGHGTAGQRSLSGSGYGIVGMRERARALGGHLDAGARAERGFGVTAFFPVGVQR